MVWEINIKWIELDKLKTTVEKEKLKSMLKRMLRCYANSCCIIHKDNNTQLFRFLSLLLNNLRVDVIHNL